MALDQTKTKTVTYTASVAAADLAKALKFARQPVERRNTVPILGTILLRFAAGHMRATGTDLDVWCESTVEAEAGASFAICVTPDYLAGIVAVAGGARVEIEVDFTSSGKTDRDGKEYVSTSATCRVRAGDLVASFKSILPADDFPGFADERLTTKEGLRETAHVGEREFHQMLADTIPFISNDETRYYLNGVYSHVKEDGTLRCVATDRHRLCLRRSETPWPTGLAGIIPKMAARILHRALRADGNGTICISGNGNYQVATPDSDDWKISYRLIDGTFPDYTRVIPQKPSTWSLPVSSGMIGRALAFSWIKGDNSEGRHLAFDLDKKTVSAKLNDGSIIAFPITGAEGAGVVGFNGLYLRDILRRHSPARIHSSGTGDLAFVDTEDPMLTQIIMPVRV